MSDDSCLLRVTNELGVPHLYTFEPSYYDVIVMCSGESAFTYVVEGIAR